MDNKLLLAIDQGTQSIRAMLFDLQGNLVAKSQVHIEPYFSREPGWAEQECSYYWKNFCKACQDLWQTHGELKNNVAAVSVTSQRTVTVCLDEQMQPVRPAIVWLDQRRTHDYPALPWWLNLGITLAGQKKSIQYFQSKAECNWLAADEPENWGKTRHFTFLSGYLNLKLTGKLCDAVGAQVGYIPFDSKKHQWAPPSDIKWKLFNAKRSQLPPLVASGKSMGQITNEAAQQTGIPEGLHIYASGSDKSCEVFASGAMSPDIASLSYGTTATINTCNTKYVEPVPFVPPFPAAIPDHYNSEIMVQRGYWMVNWFKQQFAAKEVLEAEKKGIAPEVLFDDLLAKTPAGNMGLILQPFWNPGVKIPGPEAKGAMIGFGDVHNKAHMYRSIIEGIAYALREAKDRLQKRNGIPITRLKVSGGGSQSDRIMQITADIFGLAAERPHTIETSGLGAAINAAVGAGLYPDHQTAMQNMTRSGDIFEPNPENTKIYDQLFEEVYVKLYKQLAPLYRSIRKITHYPKLD